MAIRRVKSASKVGVFDNYSAVGDDCDLKKLNLIYGFNGSGKTTLARIFASLEQGTLCSLLPDGGRFEIELEDGVVITAEANLDTLKGKVVVFDTDFVEENFQWKEGSAKPVFYIGKEQAEAGRQLQAAEARLGPMTTTKTMSATATATAARTFGQFKTNTARTIGEQIHHRTFNATHLQAEYAKGDRGPENLLDEERRDEFRNILLKDAPLPKLTEHPAISGLKDFTQQVRRCLDETVGTSMLRELGDHPSMVNWVKIGQQYHRDHGLDDCLLCGNQITEERMRAIDCAIDEKFDRIAAETQRLMTASNTLRERLKSGAASLPSRNDVTGDLRAYDEAALAYREAVRALIVALDAYDQVLKRKAETPNTRIDGGACCDPTKAAALDAATVSALERVNETIRTHNSAHDEFENTKKAAQRRLLDHYLAESGGEYRLLERQQVETAEASTKANEEHAALVKEIEEFTQKLRNHGPAAVVINSMIKAYLRHGDIEIVAHEEGFQLRRYGRHVAKNLSEGEKTAITLCYFLSALTSDGRQLKDLIVVVDDPISSLDTKALNYAFSVLKGHVGGALQLIILTHNVNFMNECRKWLKGKVEKGVAALLFLDMKSVDGVRRTTIVKLPKLLREYDSEYHYLFSLVKAFAESDGTREDYLFLMPNAMRKVAEVFLAFKRPGSNGLGDKIDALAREADKLGIDGDRFRAIDRLVQVESHGDSLEDLVAFSSMTVEESHQCAVALMDIIVKLDGEHHKRLCSQCS